LWYFAKSVTASLLFTGGLHRASKSASNLLSSGLTTSSYVKNRQQSSSRTGSSGTRRASSSVVGGQSSMSVMNSTPKSSACGLRTPRSALQSNKQQAPKPEPRSTSLHGPRLSSAGARTGTTQRNGLSLAVREPTSSLPNSPHSSDPDSLDEAGNHIQRL